jgi:uncharacterized integral membrane protein
MEPALRRLGDAGYHVDRFRIRTLGSSVRVLYWLVTALLALVVGDFAVSNRAIVDLSLFPLSETWTTEVFAPVLLALTLGFLIGLLVAWIWSWRVRRRARAQAHRIAILEREAKQRSERPSPGPDPLTERDRFKPKRLEA